MPATSVFVQLRRRESSSPIQAHLRMQSFDAAELDCNAALKIDKRMTKALFRCGLILQHLAYPSCGVKLFSGAAKLAVPSAIVTERLKISRKYCLEASSSLVPD